MRFLIILTTFLTSLIIAEARTSNLMCIDEAILTSYTLKTEYSWIDFTPDNFTEESLQNTLMSVIQNNISPVTATLKREKDLTNIETVMQANQCSYETAERLFLFIRSNPDNLYKHKEEQKREFEKLVINFKNVSNEYFNAINHALVKLQQEYKSIGIKYSDEANLVLKEALMVFGTTIDSFDIKQSTGDAVSLSAVSCFSEREVSMSINAQDKVFPFYSCSVWSDNINLKLKFLKAIESNFTEQAHDKPQLTLINETRSNLEVISSNFKEAMVRQTNQSILKLSQINHSTETLFKDAEDIYDTVVTSSEFIVELAKILGQEENSSSAYSNS